MTCDVCSGEVAQVFHVPDALWLRYCDEGDVICISCFTERVESDTGRRLYWSCAEGNWPQCSGDPCAHEEALAHRYGPDIMLEIVNGAGQFIGEMNERTGEVIP